MLQMEVRNRKRQKNILVTMYPTSLLGSHGTWQTPDWRCWKKTNGYTVYWFKTMDLTGRGNIAGIWQRLDTFLVVTMEEEALLSPGGRGQGCKASYNVQDCHLQQRIIQPQVSVVPRLRHSDLK